MTGMKQFIDELCQLCDTAAAVLPSQEGVGSGTTLVFNCLAPIIRHAAIHADEESTQKLEAALAIIEVLQPHGTI